jgi:hypothetical protein
MIGIVPASTAACPSNPRPAGQIQRARAAKEGLQSRCRPRLRKQLSKKAPGHLSPRPLPTGQRPRPVPRQSLPGEPVHGAERGLSARAPERMDRERRPVRRPTAVPRLRLHRPRGADQRAALAALANGPAAPSGVKAVGQGRRRERFTERQESVSLPRLRSGLTWENGP